MSSCVPVYEVAVCGPVVVGELLWDEGIKANSCEVSMEVRMRFGGHVVGSGGDGVESGDTSHSLSLQRGGEG